MTDLTIELTDAEYRILTDNGNAPGENLHRAIKLYGLLANADALLAEQTLHEGGPEAHD